MAKDSKIRVLVGTRKGTYVVEGDIRRKQWKVGPVAHAGSEVYHVVADPRHPGDLYAAVNNTFWGPAIQRSRDWGKTWKEIATPLTPNAKARKAEVEASEGSPPKWAINNLWHIEPGHPSEAKT